MQKAKMALIGGGLAVLMAVGLGAYWIRQIDSEDPNAQRIVSWGGPMLCVSERDYFLAEMGALFDTWEARRSRNRPWPEPDRDERCLVFDLENRLVWLSEKGVANSCDYVRLPAALSWKLCYRSEDELHGIASPVCISPSRRWNGAMALIGQSADDMHFSCVLRGSFLQGRMEWEEGSFDPNTLSSSTSAEELASVLITDPARLNKILQTRPALAVSDNSPVRATAGGDPPTDVKATWRRLQRPLYQALEQEAVKRGYEVSRISTQPGPDYTAGLAGIGFRDPSKRRRNPFWSFFLPRRGISSVPYLFFTVDALGDGRWHCQTTQRPGGGRSRRTGTDFDFYLEAQGKGPEMTLPRAEPQQGVPKWSVELDDGTYVELIGVCVQPGSTWWAPDGTDLGHWPGFWGREGYNRLAFDIMSSRSRERIRVRRISMGYRHDEGRIAVVLRVPSSTGFGNSSGSSGSGSLSVHYGKRAPLLDRFGQPGSSESHEQYIVLQFDASEQDTISHVLGIRVVGPGAKPGIIRQDRSRSRVGGSVGGAVVGGGMSRAQVSSADIAQSDADMDQSLQWIQLKNLSLHSGRHTAFEMIVAEDAGDITSISRVQLLP
jgi:hypothetical protein